jgi:predicted dehydrogenase
MMPPSTKGDQMDDRGDASRRDFLKLATAAAVAGAAQARPAAAQDKPAGCVKPSSDKRVGLATIGIGGQGTRDTKGALKVPGVELVAVADVYDGRLVRAREVFCEGLATTRDYKEILARSDVDAVIIATPDHWHARLAIEAMEAGKDVYVEKPMVQVPEDGLKVIAAQKKTGRICQVGSQRVSSILYHKAKELLASGAIGELNLVEAWWNRNSALGAWQYSIPPDASPATVDWDRFLGPALRRPFDPIRLFRWRNYDDYGTGVAGDLFVHLFSGLHVVTGSMGPTRIMATGGLRHWKDGRDAPDVLLGLFEYPKSDAHPEFTLSLKVNFADGSGGEEGFRFVGPQGTMVIGRDHVTVSRREPEKEPGFTIDTFPKAVQEAFEKEYRKQYPDRSRELQAGRDEVFRPPRDYSDVDHHLANFIEAVRTRKPVVEDAVFGLRAAGPALLCNVSQREKRPVGWNPVDMRPLPRIV